MLTMAIDDSEIFPDPQANRRYPFNTSEKPKYLSVSGVTKTRCSTDFQ